jgi:hypothetical protein
MDETKGVVSVELDAMAACSANSNAGASQQRMWKGSLERENVTVADAPKF